MLILVLGLGFYFLLSQTSFLLRESREPFRYTFWIDAFTAIEGTPNARLSLENGDRFKLLHHDLMEKLNQGFRRFSLLNAKPLDLPDEALISHINISGEYVLREKSKDC